jgi:hypothetical protein
VPPLAVVERLDAVEDGALQIPAVGPGAAADELLSLVGAQALAAAGVDVGLLDLVAQGLVGDAQVARDLGDRALRALSELDCFTPELGRIWRLGGWHRLLLA